MYIPARSPLLSLDADDEAEAEKQRRDILRRSGLVLGDGALMEA